MTFHQLLSPQESQFLATPAGQRIPRLLGQHARDRALVAMTASAFTPFTTCGTWAPSRSSMYQAQIQQCSSSTRVATATPRLAYPSNCTAMTLVKSSAGSFQYTA